MPIGRGFLYLVAIMDWANRVIPGVTARTSLKVIDNPLFRARPFGAIPGVTARASDAVFGKIPLGLPPDGSEPGPLRHLLVLTQPQSLQLHAGEHVVHV